MRSEELHNRLADLLVGFWTTQTIYAATKLKVFQMLASGPMSIHRLAKESQIHPEGAERLVWALVSLELLQKMQNGSFALTEMGQLLVPNHPYSLAHAPLVWGEEHYRAWQEIIEPLKTGSPVFQKLYGKEFFSWLESQPKQREIYHAAMREYASFDYRDVVRRCDFSKHQVVMDVGGGQGVLLCQILKQNEGLQGILFELPSVIEEARIYMQKKELLGKCSLIGGNVFERIPRGAEAIILSRVLHDWDDQHAQMILENCNEALPKGGLLYIIELCKSEEHPESSALLDLNMLIMTGGKERTQQEYENFASQNGFILERMVELRSVSSVLIFSKETSVTSLKFSQGG